MRWPDFHRGRQFGRSARNRLALYCLAICAALLLPLLVLDLGLLAHLVLGTADAAVPRDWILGPWISGRVVSWPLLNDERTCLLILVGAGIIVGGIEVWALWLLNRSVHREALDVTMRFYVEVHRQAYRLGASDLLGGRRSPPETLVGETCDELYRGLASWWSAVPYAVVALGTLVLMALVVNVWLSLVVLLSVLLVRLVYGGFAQRAEGRARSWEAAAAIQRGQLMEKLRLTPLATGYSLQHAPGTPLPELLGRYRRDALSAHYSRCALGPTLLWLTMLAVAYIVLVIGLSRYVTVAGTVVLTTAMIGAYYPAARLHRLRGSLAAANQAAGRLFAYLRREPGVREVENAVAIDRVVSSIRLEHVTLANSDGQKLLDRIDLSMAAGTRVAVIGSDPAAPLALGGLLVRLYDPAAGRVLFDGYDIATATLETIRGQSLLVPADGMLFEGSVHDNISCGDAGFTMLQITDAAKQARAHSFIIELPQGFSTRIGGDAQRLDASQAFRIGLARALLRDPSILVVVEPACVFDEPAQTLLDESLRLAAQERTMIVIPTRLSTLIAADRVVVLHEGKVEAEGAHTDLYETCELYRHLNYVNFHAWPGPQSRVGLGS